MVPAEIEKIIDGQLLKSPYADGTTQDGQLENLHATVRTCARQLMVQLDPQTPEEIEEMMVGFHQVIAAGRRYIALS